MPKKDYASFDYTAKTVELEKLLERMQSNDVSLDEALRLHEQGKRIVLELEDYLKNAELKIQERVAGD